MPAMTRSPVTPNAQMAAPMAMADASTRTLFVRKVQAPKASETHGRSRPIAAKAGNLLPGRNAPMNVRPIGAPTSMVRQARLLSPICHPRASFGPGGDCRVDDIISSHDCGRAGTSGVVPVAPR